MPVLKVKKENGAWQDIATANTHAHTVSDISDLPASLVDDVEALKDKVGADSVAYQITTAIQTNEYVHPYTHPADMITGLSDVAISGSYEDLTDKPTIPEEYVHPESHDASMITGLANVATSGSYNDLTNKPTIPSIAGLATTAYVDKQIASVSGSGGTTEQVQADWDETDTTSPAYIKNKPVISGEGGASVQANWEQNDETSADYIKNKPFGEYEGLVDILPLTQHDGFTFNPEINGYFKQVEATYTLTVDETYIVSWDGEDYECTAQDASVLFTGAIVLGNGSTFGLSGNNEPFSIAISNGFEAYLALTDTEDGGSHRVRIAKEETIMKQLDEKYLSILDHIKPKKSIIVPFAQYDNFSLNSSFNLYTYEVKTQYKMVVGETYTVSWDGIKYECVAQDISFIVKIQGAVGIGNGSTFGLSGNNEPFSINIINGWLVLVSLTDTEAGGSHSVEVVQEEKEKSKINPKYLPIPFFGEGHTQTELIPKENFQFTYYSDDSTYAFTFTPSAEQIRMWQSDWTNVDITWDGKIYTCEPQNIQGIKCVGNIDSMMGSGDNGMPFILMIADAATMGEDICIIYSVIDYPTEIHTDYLYSSASFSVVDGQNYYSIDDEISIISLDEGTEYKVTWDDTESDLVATSYTSDDSTYIAVGNPSILGLGDDNGVEYFIYTKTLEDGTQSSGVVTSSANTSHYFGAVYTPDVTHDIEAIMHQVGITTIDPKFIENISWNKITNKPFGEMLAGTVIVPQTTVNLTNQMNEELYFNIVSTMGLSDHIRDGYNYLTEFDGTIYEATGINGSNGVGVTYESDSVFFVIADNYMNSGMSIILSTYGTHTYSITYAEDTVKTIDPKFIPKIDGLPEVSTDDNGKTLLVSDGVWSVAEPVKGVPEVTIDDAGKFLRVSADGTWIVETIQNVSEVGL